MILSKMILSLKIFIIIILISIISYIIHLLLKKRQRYLRKHERRNRLAFWSIGYMESNSPLHWTPSKAKVFCPTDVDPNMYIIADPFLFEHKNERYLFFEAMLHNAPTAHIDCARFNHDKQEWELLGTILEEPFHLSYPQVIRNNDQIYMIPESKQSLQIRLYKATDFPTKWVLVKPIIEGKKLVDSTIIKWQNKWYLFTSRKKTLYLYLSDKIDGNWQPHPSNPIRRGNFSRCGGRIIQHKNKLYRISQDQRGYGAGVYALEITTLTPTKYREKSAKEFNPVLLPDSAAWTETGMHHLDTIQIAPSRYFGVFDGEQFPRLV